MPDNKIKQLEQKLDILRSKTGKGISKRKEVDEEIDVLNDLAIEISASNPKKVIDYARKGLALAKTLDYKKAIAVYYRIIGGSHSARSEYAKALDYYLRSLRISEEIEYKKGIG